MVNEAVLDKAWALWQRGLILKDVARELHCEEHDLLQGVYQRWRKAHPRGRPPYDLWPNTIFVG